MYVTPIGPTEDCEMFDSTIDISNGTSLAALIIVGCSALFPVKDKRSNLPLGYFSFKLSASSSIVWLASIFCTNLLVLAVSLLKLYYH